MSETENSLAIRFPTQKFLVFDYGFDVILYNKYYDLDYCLQSGNRLSAFHYEFSDVYSDFLFHYIQCQFFYIFEVFNAI